MTRVAVTRTWPGNALAISAVERAGNTIVPAVAGVGRGAQARLAGASSLLP